MYTFSPVKGGSGNIEYLVKLIKSADEVPLYDFRKLVGEAFSAL
jgi:23S rRNA (cytidine1920-2'-O)/16S rRNA (cytidine1409-2'-O)-methyltransferase